MHAIDFLRVVSDAPDICSYLPGRTARMPLYLPTDTLTPHQFDSLLAAGYRRSGWYFYRTQCANCSACEPLRLEVADFKPSRSQRRARNLGAQHLHTRIAKPTVDDRRLEIFNRHRNERELSQGDLQVDASAYQAFLINSYTDVVELSLWNEDLLVAVSITDVGADSLSAVYCFFDPNFSWLSPGTYAILQQIELAKVAGCRWLYLGMYVADNQHLKYKARFGPHERWIDGQWERK